MTLDQLTYFSEIVKYGSMTKASQHLLVSQPSISLTMRSLEEELGFKLFHRQPKGVILTPKGTEFLFYAENILRNIQSIKSIGSIHSTKTELSIAVNSMFFSVLSVSELIENALNDTSFTIKLVQRTLIETINDVAQEKAQIGLVQLSIYQQNLIENLLERNHMKFYELCRTTLFIAVTSQHPLYEKDSVSYQDIANYPLVTINYSDDEYLGSVTVPNFHLQSFSQRIIVSELMHLFYLCETRLAVGLLFSNNRFNANSVFKKFGIQLKYIPYVPTEEFLTGYIINERIPLNDIEKKYIDTLSNQISQSITHDC